MLCACGHHFAVHTDRALFPACEGAGDAFQQALGRDIEGWTETYFFVNNAKRSTEPPCLCKGFHRG